METSFLRQLPQNAEAELSVLGALLIDSERMSDVAGSLRAEDFYLSQNREIYEALLSMYAEGQSIDLVTLLDTLKTRGTLSSVGGKEYLMNLLELVPTAHHLSRYVEIVQEKSNLRKFITASDEIIALCMEQGDDAKVIMDLAEQKIFAITENRALHGLVPIKEAILETYDRLHFLEKNKGAYLGAKTGFSDLDRVLTGLNNSDLVLVAARPGMGKTSFALNIAQHAGSGDKSVVIFSLEMSKEQLISRMLSSEALIDSHKLRTGDLTDDDWMRLGRASSVLSGSRLYLDDSSGINALEMKAKCRRIKDLGLIVIDYLQLMQGNRRNDNRTQEISEITRSLKLMAKELNVPVLCLSQLSRGPEGRADKRPMLSDLRESGAIEQDADSVLFLYRDDYYNPESEDRNIAECIIAKNRHGPTGKIKLQWLEQYTRFTSQDTHHEP